ncbi:S-adenosylmethionine decarboxylase proenzyme 4 [Canna indica]|uniref:S-adenosylmethionine decarboxylase proenzyme n=1 Tax=Canna indica TaxID=4628 RepID=A0AAQ3KWK7_9LILI|nr:S-adenosylmethionine decarboxylase proenzyme 4 [Canna indica]
MAAVSGFEGFEKRLELHFLGGHPLGLRRLCCDTVNQVLDAVQCTVVSAVGNRYFDAYILSESSLFVYPHKMVMKTCGTTQLLRSLPCLLRHTADLGLSLCACRYSRGSFIFPQAQPFPHTSFAEEVLYLEERLPPSLCFRRARVLPSNNSHSWHIYSAAASDAPLAEGPSGSSLTVEVCMTELDRTLARRFFRKKGDKRSGDAAGADMTGAAGIGGINPRALVCGFAFDPCGYSMNGLDRDRYSTIHVTPEDGHSYASFECTGSRADEVIQSLRRAVAVFRPGAVSVSFCTATANYSRQEIQALRSAMEPLGLTSCGESEAAEEFPGVGIVTYQVFTAPPPQQMLQFAGCKGDTTRE